MARVLLVEDEFYLREMIEEKIKDVFPVEVISVDSGNNAMKVLGAETDFRIIISDFRMSDGDGDDLLRYVREKHIAIPFMFFTSCPIRDYAGNAEKFLGFVSKDNFEGLCEMISNVLH